MGWPGPEPFKYCAEPKGRVRHFTRLNDFYFRRSRRGAPIAGPASLTKHTARSTPPDLRPGTSIKYRRYTGDRFRFWKGNTLWGDWAERAGPHKAGVVAACCWCGGLLISAVGVIVHQLWMLWIGSGVIGGIGLGLGYISPVSTLVKWFPDRRGMALAAVP
jgi:hypothetical protein